MKSKKGFSTMDFTIAMLIFSGIIALLVVAVGSLASDYDNKNVVNPEFSSKFDRFENSTGTAQDMWEAVRGEEGLTLVGTVEILFFSTFQVISLVLSSVVEAGSQLAGLGDFFGIPTTVTYIFYGLVISILMVIIIFKILSFVKGSKDL